MSTASLAIRAIIVLASGYLHLFSSRRMWSTAFMIEEERASVGRSRGGSVRLVEEHAQGGGTRTALYAQQGSSTGMGGLLSRASWQLVTGRGRVGSFL